MKNLLEIAGIVTKKKVKKIEIFDEHSLRNKSSKFNEFYDIIKHKEFTTAALQEFLFYNRKCENILKIVDKFTEIIDKNDPKNFEVLKEENKNFYSYLIFIPTFY